MYNILIVEDEVRIASFVDKGLRKQGFKTAIATDGKMALSVIKSHQFDLIILDIGLPVMDGWTVLEKLRIQGIYPSVIVVTAQENLEHDLPNVGYLKKPFRFQALLEKIDAYLQHKS
jgi:DNA-binding response OmpR family regulator